MGGLTQPTLGAEERETNWLAIAVGVGVVVVICAAILGQMVGSYLADTLGWFGVERVPFNPVRLAGIGLLVLGVLLVQRK